MELTIKINGKKYVWDKHSPSVWRTERGNVVKSKSLLDRLEEATEALLPLPEQKWTPCGLNGDWNCQAYHYGKNQPNTVDGDYYVLELEGDAGGEGWHVARYFPNKDEDCTEGLTPNKDREGDKGFPSLASAKAFIEGVFETSERLVKELSAEDRAYVTDEERGEFFGFGAYHDLYDANMVLWDLCSKMSEEQGFGAWDEDDDEEDKSHTLDYFSAIIERFNDLLKNQ